MRRKEEPLKPTYTSHNGLISLKICSQVTSVANIEFNVSYIPTICSNTNYHGKTE
jgi:hypothetical protein